MKTLFLLRHAEAATGAVDFERRLTPAGLQAARALGVELRARHYTPEKVYCSEARRTRETLAALGLAAAAEFLPGMYGATPGELLTIIQNVEAAAPSLLLVGHNPAVHSLVHGLTDDARVRDRYAPGTLAVVEFDGEWDEVAPGSGRLVELIIPH